MEKVVHPSIPEIWNSFIKVNISYKAMPIPDAWYFCDNEKDANECADLVAHNIKRATSTSLWWFEKHKQKLPNAGDVYIVTDWKGVAKAIIRTTKVTEVPFKHITAAYAAIEGEGDKSLEYWRKVHWDYYAREMEPFGEAPDLNMMIVCEEFETIWPNNAAANSH